MIGFVLIGWLTTTVILAVFCQYYKVRAETLAEEVLVAHDWVDEIVQALKDPDVDQGDRSVAALVDGRPGGSPDGDVA